MGDSSATSCFIEGVRVNFPMKPYPSQVAMMAKIMKGLNKKENCLLESPTGTGKSLALLCSTLAWQKAEEDRVSRYNGLIDQGITDPDILDRIYNSGNFISTPNLNSSVIESQQNNTQSTQGTISQGTSSVPSDSNLPRGTTGLNNINHSTTLEGGFVRDANNDGQDDSIDFRDNVPRFRSVSAFDDTIETQNLGAISNADLETVNREVNQPRRKRTPKIYFGTRTHKQIFQIIRELRKTEYKNVRSVVLGSREHTCIHPVVSKSKSKNEGCKALLESKEGETCLFHHGVNRIKTHEQLSSLGHPPVWDLEDLVKLGKRVKACPYFAARHLMETAQIVFCPYNYIIDPLIRASMSIDLRQHILVLDEAHNVEDSSRDAASSSLTQDALLEAKNDLEKLSSYGVKPEMCEQLIKLVSNLSVWMDINKDNLTDYSEFGKTGKIFSGEEMVNNLTHLEIGPKDLSRLEGCLNKLNEDTESDNDTYKPSAATSQLLSGLFLILKYMFKNDMKYVSDYKVALVKAQTFAKRRFAKNSAGWIGRKSGPTNDYIYSLNFWCFNPGVAFAELGIMTRCIILTSGTLSPMNSFESELNVKFHVKFEANHVIDKEQVWVGTISRGPTNHMLNATFKHSETLAFQDELGRMILEVCESIPGGVLCFLPSYAMLDKLIDRWQISNIWEQIERVKIPIREPRNSEDFENSMKLFYSTVEETKNSQEGVSGALFIAVCRGKVSEGLDFADDNARAVIAVGIPFPNTKDIQVNLKRQYNDKYSKSKGLLSGGEWYEIQAYRALNQALGRCIRHRYDWGAIILVDERYQTNSGNNRYVKGLSKWVRNSLKHETIFSISVSQLKLFSSKMVENEKEKKTENADQSSHLLNKVSDTVKLKFTTPPIFQSSKSLIDPNNTEDPISVRRKNNDRTSEISIVLDIKDGDYAMPKPQTLSLATPVNDIFDNPLTPIVGKNSNHQSPKAVFPLTSTQISQVCQPNNSGRIIGYINKQFTFPGLTSTPNATPVKNVDANSKIFPIFESASKRRKTIEAEDSVLASPLPSSPEREIINISEDDLDKVISTGKENRPSYSSDDLFAEEIDKTQNKIKEINLDEGSAKKQKRKLQRKSSRSQLNNSIRKQSDDLKSQTLARPSNTGEKDSDLDDFDLNSSILVTRRKSTGKRTKQKGVVFSDYE